MRENEHCVLKVKSWRLSGRKQSTVREPSVSRWFLVVVVRNAETPFNLVCSKGEHQSTLWKFATKVTLSQNRVCLIVTTKC